MTNIKAKGSIHGLSHKFLRNHNEIRVLQKYRAAASISGYRAVYLGGNGELFPADHYSPNVAGFLATDATIAEAGSASAVVAGPAYAYPQSSIDPLLPIKVTEAGRITHGIQKIHSGRTIYTAAAGEDGTEVATPIIVGSGGTDKITVVSDDATDITQGVVVYAYSDTEGLLRMTGVLNGTTEVVLTKPGGTETDDITLVYGCQLSAAAAGTVKIEDYTANTDLIVITTGNTTAGWKSATNATYSYGRKVLITFSDADAADSVVLVGTDLGGNLQAEMIMGSNGNCPLVLESANRYRTVDYVLDGNCDDAHTVGVTGLASNAFIVMHTDVNNVTYDDNDQPINDTGTEVEINIASSAAGDDAATVVLIGYDENDACITEEVTVSGGGDSASTDKFMEVSGAYLSSATTLAGTLDIEEDTGKKHIWDDLDASYTSCGMLGIALGHSAATAATAHDCDLDLPGCNSRFTLTSNNTAATDVVCVIGEDIDGSVQREKCTLHDGVYESANTWSRIRYIACAEMDKTEYLTLSFEQEDDGQEFCGVAIGSADAQSTTTAVEIWVKEAYGVQWGKGADQSILQRVIGTTGYTDIDTYASAARTVFFPDASGTIFLTGASANTNIITVGATDCDYTTLALADAAATAGDWVWLMDESYSGTAQTQITTNGLRVTGMSGGSDSEWPGNKVIITSSVASATGSTIEVTGTGVVLENLEIKNTANSGASDCALQFTNVGGHIRNCYLNQSNSRRSLWFTNNAAADDLTLEHVYLSEDFVHDGGTASATLKMRDVYIGGAYTTADKIIVDAKEVSIVGVSTIVGGVHTYVDTTFTGAVSQITTAGTFEAHKSVFTGLFTSNITGNTVSIYESVFADKLYLDDCGTVTIKGCNIAGDGTNSLQADAIATSATFYDCNLADQSDINAGTLSFYGGSLEAIDDDGATAINIYNAYVSGNVAFDGTAINAFSTHFEGDFVEAGGTGTATADFCYFDGDVTNAGGTFTFTSCYINGTATGTIGGADRLDLAMYHPSGIITVGTGCNYTGINAAMDACTGGETILVFNTSETITATVAADVAVTIIGMADDCTITASTDITTLTITAAGCEFRNIHFDNTDNDGAADTTVHVDDVGAKFINCNFAKTTGGADICLNIDADGADTVEFHNCNVTDGPIDADGNALSNLYWYGGVIDDTIAIDTGNYFFEGVEINGALTTGAAAKATLYFKECNFGAAVTVTDTTLFNAQGGTLGSTLTVTASDAAYFADMAITGNVAVVASTYIDFANVRFGGTFTQSGAVTEGYLRDCDVTGTFDMGTAGAMFEAHDTRFTGNVTLNQAAADFEAHNCEFLGALASTDTSVFRIQGGNIAGALTLTDGTFHEISDTTVTGAVSIVVSAYVDISNTRFANNIAISGAVTEMYLRDIDVTGTFAQATAAVTTLVINDSRFTGTFGINHADTDLKAFDSYFIGAVTITDADDIYFHNCEFDAQFTLTLSDIAEFHDCYFDMDLASTTSGILRIYDSRIDDASTWNHASLTADIQNVQFGGLLTITDAATLTFDGCHFDGTNSLIISDVQTAARIYSSRALDLVTISEGTLIELFDSNFEEFIDDDSDDINIYRCTFTSTVVPDSADWDSYNCDFLGAVTESAATAMDDWGSRIAGVLTQAAGTVTLHGTRLESAPVGTIAGDFNYYTANYIEEWEGGLDQKQLIGLASMADSATPADPEITPPFTVLTWKGITTGLGLTEGNLAGGNATQGYWRFDAAADDVFVGFTLPDDFIDTGVAGDLILEIAIDANNAADTFDWGVYEVDPTTGNLIELDAQIGDSPTGAAYEWHILDSSAAVGLGDMAWTKGRGYVLYLGNFNGVSDDIYGVRLTYKTGKQNVT